MSVVEDGEVESAEAVRVGDHVDFGDPAVRDREAEYQEQPSAGAITSPAAPLTSAGSVDRARSMAAIAPLTRRRARLASCLAAAGEEVAARLVEPTPGRPAGLVPVPAEPKVYGTADPSRGCLQARGRRRLMVPGRMPDRMPGKADCAYRAAKTWDEGRCVRAGTPTDGSP